MAVALRRIMMLPLYIIKVLLKFYFVWYCSRDENNLRTSSEVISYILAVLEISEQYCDPNCKYERHRSATSYIRS